MSLTSVRVTPLHVAFDEVRRAAQARGTLIERQAQEQEAEILRIVNAR
jgi:hypothetical protein